MYGYVFLFPAGSGRGKIQLGELLEEERAGHGPPEVPCRPWLRPYGSGQFPEDTKEKVLGKLPIKVDYSYGCDA